MSSKISYSLERNRHTGPVLTPSATRAGPACSDLRGVLLVDDKTACLYILHLWHDTGAVLVIGNPGGKCRDFVDAKLNKVVRRLWWQ